MANTRKVYIESSCFIELAKHAIGGGNGGRLSDVWYLKALLKASKEGKVQVLTATLTIAECQHAEEPSSDGLPSDPVKLVFKNLLSSGQYVFLIQDTVLVAERARNLRWAHGICMHGPDAVHAASALEIECEEFLSFDRGFHKKKKQFEDIALYIRLPRNTACLPIEYRQGNLLPDEDQPALPLE